MSPSFIKLANNRKIAYHLSAGKTPCVMFFGGFNSDMNGTKVTSLETFCKEREQMFIRFDYSGHGESDGKFMDGTIGSWKEDALNIIDSIAPDNNIFVGSSMGAWIAMLCAIERKEKLAALIGIASAPDFTENLIWKKLNEEQRERMGIYGVYYAPSCYGEDPYPITMKLIEEGRNHLILDKKIDIDVPVRLLHGMKDSDVPFDTSAKIAHAINSDDINITLIKDGDHRLSQQKYLDILFDKVGEFI
ncbi:MAG: alpha/beta hydrolase [Rickettsiales bacterium]